MITNMKKLTIVLSFVVCLFNQSLAQDWKTYRDSAELYKTAKDFDKATDAFLKAHAAMPADSLLKLYYMQFLISMGSNYNMAGQAGDFIPVLEQSKKNIAQHGAEESATYAFICNYLGALYTDAGEFDAAAASHLKAKQIREKLLPKGDPAIAQSLNNLGALYSEMGRYADAEPLLVEAKAIREKLKPEKKSPVYAITSVALANLYRRMGQYEKAEALYLDAKAIRGADSAARKTELYATTCNILADLYYYTGNYEKAEPLFLEAKTVRGNINNQNLNYGQTCNNLANLYTLMGRYKEAEALALEAQKIYEAQLPEGHASRTIQTNGMGELYAAMGEHKKAEAHFLQAREWWEKTLGKDHPYFIANSEQLSRVYWQTGETEKAAALIAAAAAAKYKGLSNVFYFTAEAEKEQYIKNISGSNDEYYSFYYKTSPRKAAEQMFNLSLAARNLILSSNRQTRQNIHSSGDSSLIKKYTEWSAIKERLSNLFARGDTTTALLKPLEEKADGIEKELARKSSAFKKAQTTATWQELQKNLMVNEAAIEFIRFRIFDGKDWVDSTIYGALILKKVGTPQFVRLFEKNALYALFRDQDANPATKTNALYTSPALYNTVWRSMEKNLTGITKIYFAPAGEMFNLSLAAMPLNSKQVLSDKYHLVQLASTASLTNKGSDFSATAQRMQLYGGVYYDADSTAMKAATVSYHTSAQTDRSFPDDLRGGKTFQYLTGTQQEVEAIKQQGVNAGAKVSALTAVDASEESLYALNGAASPNVLHIATHGFFFPEPGEDKDKLLQKFETVGKSFKQSSNPLMRSALVFSGANNAWQGRFVSGVEDGIATAYEISTRLYLPNTKLVVLSACETALGDVQGSEGVYGLQRAFSMAGAQNLVMSLWKVPDAETAAFMQNFYGALFAKQNVSEAFRTAQQAMKNKYRNEPYKWAAWVLVR